MGVQGIGRGRRQVQLAHPLSHIPRDTLNGRLHCGHHALGFLATLSTPLAEPFLLGTRAKSISLGLDIPGSERAVAPYPSLQVDTVGGVTDGAATGGDLLTLPREALVLVVSGFHVLLDLLEARCHLCGATRATLGRLAVGGGAGLWDPLEHLVRFRGRLCGRPLFDSQRGRHRLAECMLSMEEVRRVMGSKVGFDLRQQSWGLIAGRWHDWTVEPRQGLFHEGIPGIVILCECRVLSKERVAHRVHPDQAQAACTGFILGERPSFGWHLLRQPRALLVAVRHEGRFHTTVDLVLRPRGGAHTPLETRALQEQTHQAHPTGPHLDTHQVEPQDQPMQEGETRRTVKKCDDRGTGVETLLVRVPGLQRATGNRKGLRGLTLGEALGVQIAIRRPEGSALEALPALGAISVASLRILDYRSPSSLLFPSWAFVGMMAKDGEVAFWFQPCVVSSR